MNASPDRILRDGFDAVVTESMLHAVMPDASVRDVRRLVSPINTCSGIYRIRRTRERLAAFLATVAVETLELRYMAEIWGPTAQQRKYEPPGRLARELGNTQPGDGYRFKGRGLIMVTGRRHYTWVAGVLDLDCVSHPERLEEPYWAAMAAGEWWRKHNCNEAADTGGIVAVTKIVNGGLTHIDRRRAYYERALTELERLERQ